MEQKGLVVQTDKGKIQGLERSGIQLFRGIPYGGNVSGTNRFCPPCDTEKWNGIKDCTRFGSRAIQGPALDPNIVPEAMKHMAEEVQKHFTGDQKVAEEKEMSEECLFLNVSTPACDAKKRPVLFYIHGGAFMSGGGGLVADTSDRMIKENDLVIVSVNHRLNMFGYLYLGGFDSKYESSGLVGMLDLVQALQWVKRNITAFGGDPQNVTLIGESGGGLKILTLMAMPEAKGLFQKAVVISGSERIGIKSREEAHAQTLRVMKKLGLEDDEWRQLIFMPPEQLFQACEDPSVFETIAVSYYPIADDVHIPINPDGRFHAYDCSFDVPLMIGSSEDEIAQWMKKIDPEMTESGVREILLGNEDIVTAVLPNIQEKDVEAIIQSVKETDSKEKEPWHLLLQILSAANFLGGGAFPQALVKTRQGGAPVWLWSTAYDSYNPLNPSMPCSWHTADLAYMFRAVWRKEAENLSKIQAGGNRLLCKIWNTAE